MAFVTPLARAGDAVLEAARRRGSATWRARCALLEASRILAPAAVPAVRAASGSRAPLASRMIRPRSCRSRCPARRPVARRSGRAGLERRGGVRQAAGKSGPAVGASPAGATIATPVGAPSPAATAALVAGSSGIGSSTDEASPRPDDEAGRMVDPEVAARRRLHQKAWRLPAVALLDPASESAEAGLHDHARNVRIIEEKLRSFQIPAEVVGTNSGPVVTQYEVKPDVRVKLSRIEGLADDLAMALAARTIRIEAPIPGRDVVGIEIPNHSSEVVGFRSLYEDARMARRDQQADLRPRPRRLGQGLCRGPGADAAPAHRGCHRLGQVRLRQRAHHQPPACAPRPTR